MIQILYIDFKKGTQNSPMKLGTVSFKKKMGILRKRKRAKELENVHRRGTNKGEKILFPILKQKPAEGSRVAEKKN